MKQILERYIPERALDRAFELIKTHHVHLKIVDRRLTKHGDYRRYPDGSHLITINASRNPYSFLITLIHEIAHLVAYRTYGNNIKPHGAEWKHTFRELMTPFIHPSVFPPEVIPLLVRHFQNPKASSGTDSTLALALKQYDPPNNKKYVFEIPFGTLFRIHNGRVFRKFAQRVKRYECIEIATGKTYLFNPNAEVDML
ncbi:MAG: SprT-like domain-containing protein [Bacteroidota bacterium]|nr:SprT-like domain-containing protein [Bacteroidota bacterium]